MAKLWLNEHVAETIVWPKWPNYDCLESIICPQLASGVLKRASWLVALDWQEPLISGSTRHLEKDTFRWHFCPKWDLQWNPIHTNRGYPKLEYDRCRNVELILQGVTHEA